MSLLFLSTVIFACCKHKVRNTTDATKKNAIYFISNSPSYSVLSCIVIRNRLNKHIISVLRQWVESSNDNKLSAGIKHKMD